jgi:hypothetical protein
MFLRTFHRRFQTVFDRERAAIDEEISLERRQTDDARKNFDEFGVGFGVNIGVRDFDFGGARKLPLNIDIVEVRMIETDRERTEEAVEIDETMAVGRVI